MYTLNDELCIKRLPRAKCVRWVRISLLTTGHVFHHLFVPVLCLAAPSFSIQHTHFLLYRTCLILTLLLSAPSARCFCFFFFFVFFWTFWVELKNYADDCPSLDSLRISLPPSGLIIVLGFLLFPNQPNSLYL